MIYNSFRNKLIAVIMIMSILPLLLFGGIIHTKISDNIINKLEKMEINNIENSTQKLQMWFKDKEEILISITNNYPLLSEKIHKDNSFKDVCSYLKSQKQISNSILNIFITLKDGSEYNSESKPLHNIDTRNRDWYINAVNEKNIVWTKVYRDILSDFKKRVITVSMPIYDDNGKTEGVLGIDFAYEEVDKILKEFGVFKEKYSTYIVSSEGLAIDVYGKDVLGKKRNGYEFNNIFYNEDKYIKIDNKSYFKVHSFIKQTGWSILYLIPKSILYKYLMRLNDIMINTIIISLGLATIIAYYFSKRISSPLEKLKKGAYKIQKGNYDYRVNIKEKDEIGEVARAFNNMAFELKETYDSLKRQTNQLINKNEQLQEMNIEMEASYEQLVATTEQLNESEQKYKVLIDNMYDLVLNVDKNYNIVFINNQINEMLGYDKEEIVGKNLFHLTHILTFENIEDINNLYSNLEKKDYKDYETTFVTKDNRKVIVEINTKRIFELGRFVGVQFVAKDVTMKRKMENQILVRNRELFVINEISEQLNSTLDLEELLKNVVDNLVELLNISLCTIRILSKDHNKLELMAYSGQNEKTLEAKLKNIIHMDDAIMWSAVKSGKILTDNDVSKQDMSTYDKKFFLNNNFTIIPMISRGEVRGLITSITDYKVGDSEKNILCSVAHQTAMMIENINLYRGLKESYMKTIKSLAAAVEAKDEYTEGHSLRVSKFSSLIAENIGLLFGNINEEIEIGGILHDMGKIGINDSILSKPGRLTESEYEQIKLHPMIGAKIIEKIGFSKTIMDIVKYHHKRYDLKGYPEDEELEYLPLEACIVGVADAFDAMTSTRSYRNAMSIDDAINELIANKGTQFHPKVVDTVVDIYNKDKDKLLNIINL